MKTITFLLAFLITQFTFATDDKYMQQMAKQIKAVYEAQTIEELQLVVNTLDRIGAAEKTKWEPYYYSAFGSLMMANREADGAKKDTYLDLAMNAIENGKKLNNHESELVALEGFVHMLRVTVDPATRGQQYSTLAFQTYGKALGMNPENPRALSLLAQMQFGTAKFFNAPTNEACSTTKKAVEKFASFKSDNPLAPRWGQATTETLLQNCK